MPANPTDRIDGCRFDSDSSAFKTPYRNQGVYSLHHIRLLGNAQPRPWQGNTFAHAMWGIHIPNKYGWADLVNNEFRTCFVAGVGTGDVGYYPHPGAAGPGYDVRLDQNTFYLPHYQPPSSQRTSLTTSYHGDQCHGAMLEAAVTVASNNRFVQVGLAPALKYTYFTTRFPETRIGLRSSLLVSAEDNTFTGLTQGLNANLTGGSEVTLRGNSFTDCERGLVLGCRPGYLPWASGSGPFPDPVVFTTCNSFVRSATRSGPAIGIDIEPRTTTFLVGGIPVSSQVPVLDDMNNLNPSPGAGTVLKDLFDPSGKRPGDFMAIVNRTGVSIEYRTFFERVQMLSAAYPHSYKPYVYGIALQDGGMMDVRVPPQNARLWPCRYDLFPDAGIQQLRSAGAVPVGSGPGASIGQNVPNPCSGSTALDYHLPPGSQQAQVLVRRGLDGKAMEQVTLKTGGTQYLLDLRHYAPGLYFYTLVVDGVPVQTKRMLVE